MPQNQPARSLFLMTLLLTLLVAIPAFAGSVTLECRRENSIAIAQVDSWAFLDPIWLDCRGKGRKDSAKGLSGEIDVTVWVSKWASGKSAIACFAGIKRSSVSGRSATTCKNDLDGGEAKITVRN